MNTSDALDAATRALKVGDKARSQKLLAPILQADPRNERAWGCAWQPFWMTLFTSASAWVGNSIK